MLVKYAATSEPCPWGDLALAPPGFVAEREELVAWGMASLHRTGGPPEVLGPTGLQGPKRQRPHRLMEYYLAIGRRDSRGLLTSSVQEPRTPP